MCLYDTDIVYYLDCVEMPSKRFSADVSLELDGIDLPAGGNMISASVVVTDPQDDPSNNSAVSVFSLEAKSGGLAGHNFRPNPVSVRFDEAMLCMNMEIDADIHVEIFNLEGESISRGKLGYGYGVPLDPGYSCFRCGDIFPGVDRLASGVYFYRISLFLLDGTREEYRGRFAVAN